jgi:hypothetical protein
MTTHKNQMELIFKHNQPKSTEELAEFMMVVARNMKDEDGKHIYFKLDPTVAYHIASMMRAAKLKVPK